MTFLVLVLSGITFSVLRVVARPQNAWLYIVGALTFLAEAGWHVSSIEMPTGYMNVAGAFGVIIPLLVGGICWAGFFHGALTTFVIESAREMLGLNQFKEHFSFDQAEAAEARHEYEEAARLYQEAAEKMEDRPEPRIRLAELFVKMNRYGKATEAMQEALELATDIEDRAKYSFRLAEIQELAGKGSEAAETLRQFKEEARSTKFADYAEGRLSHLERE